MSDESRLQAARDSSASLLKARSRMIARGLRDALLLVPPAVRATETDKAFILEGVCNKCRENKELVLAARVCASCSDALDKNWAGSAATDWVLVAFSGPEPPKTQGIYSRSSWFSYMWEGLDEGWMSRDQLWADTSWLPFLYVYTNTTYEQMKCHWATCNPPDSVCVGRISFEEFAQETDTYHGSYPHYDTAWLRGRPESGNVVPYIRPATDRDLYLIRRTRRC